MKVTVYSKPRCQPCNGTKRALTRNKIPFTEVDVTSSAEAADPILDLGYREAPVVIVEFDDHTEHWGGYRPTRVEDLVRHLAEEVQSA